MSDAVRLPNGKTVTRNRALSRGWIDAEGNLTNLAPRPSGEQKARDKAARAADWRRTQGLPPLGDTPDNVKIGTTLRVELDIQAVQGDSLPG